MSNAINPNVPSQSAYPTNLDSDISASDEQSLNELKKQFEDMIAPMENTLEPPVELPVESNPQPSGEQPVRVARDIASN
jgi:hypothetical protein